MLKSDVFDNLQMLLSLEPVLKELGWMQLWGRQKMMAALFILEAALK